MWRSVFVAAFAELPLAVLLISGTLRLMRMMGGRLWLLPPDGHLWNLELPA
ncbi:Uncharacterised protein [Mycobacterium tuberculosis]|nr:Uncharacterised protein [Mycobacterium tuberculosis]